MAHYSPAEAHQLLTAHRDELFYCCGGDTPKEGSRTWEVTLSKAGSDSVRDVVTGSPEELAALLAVHAEHVTHIGAPVRSTQNLIDNLLNDAATLQVARIDWRTPTHALRASYHLQDGTWSCFYRWPGGQDIHGYSLPLEVVIDEFEQEAATGSPESTTLARDAAALLRTNLQEPVLQGTGRTRGVLTDLDQINAEVANLKARAAAAYAELAEILLTTPETGSEAS